MELHCGFKLSVGLIRDCLGRGQFGLHARHLLFDDLVIMSGQPVIQPCQQLPFCYLVADFQTAVLFRRRPTLQFHDPIGRHLLAALDFHADDRQDAVLPCGHFDNVPRPAGGFKLRLATVLVGSRPHLDQRRPRVI